MNEISQRRVALIKRLHRRKTREREGVVLVEGVRAVREALTAGAEARFAVTTEGLGRIESGAALAELIHARVAERSVVSARELADLAATETPQGVLLVCSEPEGSTALSGGEGRLLMLDAIQDPGNVGTLIRSALAFGFDGVVVLDGSADPWGPKAVRASAGTVFRQRVLKCDLTTALRSLEEGSIQLWAAAADGAPIGTKEVRGHRICLAVGNEGRGVRAGVRDAAVEIVSVEMEGPVESLNAGVAGSVLMHAIAYRGEAR